MSSSFVVSFAACCVFCRSACAFPQRRQPSLKTPESKKEEFRKYLEKSGVIDALTKVLVGLYEEPERPPNAVDYIKRQEGR